MPDFVRCSAARLFFFRQAAFFPEIHLLIFRICRRPLRIITVLVLSHDKQLHRRFIHDAVLDALEPVVIPPELFCHWLLIRGCLGRCRVYHHKLLRHFVINLIIDVIGRYGRMAVLIVEPYDIGRYRHLAVLEASSVPPLSAVWMEHDIDVPCVVSRREAVEPSVIIGIGCNLRLPSRFCKHLLQILRTVFHLSL